MTYQTKARKLIISLLTENSGERMSIENIIQCMGDTAPGKSTVYRQVKALCDEGLIHRFLTEDGGALYQLAGKSCCSEHLHMKCLGCGLLLHLDESAQTELCRSTGFVIDDGLSMLYGKCAKCAGRAR